MNSIVAPENDYRAFLAFTFIERNEYVKNNNLYEHEAHVSNSL